MMNDHYLLDVTEDLDTGDGLDHIYCCRSSSAVTNDEGLVVT